MNKYAFTFAVLLLLREADSFCIHRKGIRTCILPLRKNNAVSLSRFEKSPSFKSTLSSQQVEIIELPPTPADAETVGRDKKKSDEIEAFEAAIYSVVKYLRLEDDDTLYPPIFRSTRSKMSMSYLWNTEMWRKNISRTRYLRHICGFFSSRLMKRILPQFTSFCAWAALYLFVVGQRVNKIKEDMVPLTSLSLVSSFVAFLLTLRSNQGLDRLSEGRMLWGRMFIVTRDTAQLLATYVYSRDKKLGVSTARHLALFPWLMKGLLRDTDDTDLVHVMLPKKKDADYLNSQRKKPAACIARIRQVVADLAQRNVMPVAAHQEFLKNLNEMNYILGMCERLRGSPIPPLYTSHTSRLLVFYLFFLPIALQGAHMKNTVTMIVTATVAFAMLGLDEISFLLEQPFQLMPLHELSKGMMLDVADAFVCQPCALASKELLLDEDEFFYPYDENNTQPDYW